MSGLPADLDQRRADVERLVRTFDGDPFSKPYVYGIQRARGGAAKESDPWKRIGRRLTHRPCA